MKDLHDNFVLRINRNADKNDKASPKLFIYSTHDTQIAIILNSWDSFNMLAPPFGSTILIELYSANDHTEYFLQFKYINETLSEKSYILSPSCCNLVRCEFHAFFNCVHFVTNWRKECMIHDWACNLKAGELFMFSDIFNNIYYIASYAYVNFLTSFFSSNLQKF